MTRADLSYGIDGFPYVVGLSGTALAAGTAAALARRRPRVALGAALVAACAGVPAGLGWRYVLSGKPALRDRVLDEVTWRGDETVVDLGAGRGLLALGAARRTSGRVICVDLFVAKDLSGNSPDRLRANAERLGVADRIDIRRVDVRETGLPDASVDVIVSALCVHNVPSAEGRRAAIAEAARILRPGGTVVISDLAHVDDEYGPELARHGLDVTRRGRVAGTFPRQRMIVAHRPV